MCVFICMHDCAHVCVCVGGGVHLCMCVCVLAPTCSTDSFVCDDDTQFCLFGIAHSWKAFCCL